MCCPTSNQYGPAAALNAIMVDVQEGLQRIQLPDGIVARLARIMAAVPSQVLRIAVAILLAIGQVMFVLITDQVGQGEAVVAGNKIDAMTGFTITLEKERQPSRPRCPAGIAAGWRRWHDGRRPQN